MPISAFYSQYDHCTLLNLLCPTHPCTQPHLCTQYSSCVPPHHFIHNSTVQTCLTLEVLNTNLSTTITLTLHMPLPSVPNCIPILLSIPISPLHTIYPENKTCPLTPIPPCTQTFPCVPTFLLHNRLDPVFVFWFRGIQGTFLREGTNIAGRHHVISQREISQMRYQD